MFLCLQMGKRSRLEREGLKQKTWLQLFSVMEKSPKGSKGLKTSEMDYWPCASDGTKNVNDDEYCI